MDKPKEKQSYEQQITEYYNGNLKPGELIFLGKTPPILQDLGAKDVPIIMTQSILKKCIREPKGSISAHNLSRDIIERLPDQIMNPAIVIESKERQSLILICDIKDFKEDFLLIAIKISDNQKNIEMNELKSAYGRTGLKDYLLRQEKEEVIITDIKKARYISKSLGLQLPTEWKVSSYLNNLPYDGINVNEKSENPKKENIMEQNITENRRQELEYYFENERDDLQDTKDWRKGITEEENKLVQKWDRIMAGDLSGLEENRNIQVPVTEVIQKNDKEQPLTSDIAVNQLLESFSTGNHNEEFATLTEAISYVESMDKQLDKAILLLQNMKDKINQSVKEETISIEAANTSKRFVAPTINRIDELKEQVAEVKQNIKAGALELLNNMKEKGNLSLHSVLKKMGIKERLCEIRDSIYGSLDQISRINHKFLTMDSEFQKSTNHLKNVGRAAAGNDLKESSIEKAMGITVLAQKPLHLAQEVLLDLKGKTEKFIGRLEQLDKKVELDRSRKPSIIDKLKTKQIDIKKENGEGKHKEKEKDRGSEK